MLGPEAGATGEGDGVAPTHTNSRSLTNRAGYTCLHVAVDNFFHVAYVELLPNERKGTASAFTVRTLTFGDHMMTDNGGCYRSREFNGLPKAGGRSSRLHQVL